MRIVGFNITKISAEKLKEISKDLKINTNINITDIFELKSEMLKSKENLLGAKFTLKIDYTPEIAKIEVSGILAVLLDKKFSKEILENWKKKKILDDFQAPLFNIVLKKASLKALELEDELNLPLHLPFPSFKKENKK